MRTGKPPGRLRKSGMRRAFRLQSMAGAADVGLTWLETPLDAEFSPILTHRADAALGWIVTGDALPPSLDLMTLGEFEPVVWLPADHPAAERAGIGLDELAAMDVIHGPWAGR